MKKTYLLTLFFFKLSVGALLLLIGWDILGIKGNSTFNVALVTGLAFLPAAFSKPIYNYLAHWSESKITEVSLFIASFLTIFEMFIIQKSLIAFSIIHFVLWIIIFLIEASLERWFVSVAKSIPQEQIKKLSGLSMAVIQVAIILGPICVAGLKIINENLSYFAVAGFFLIGGLLSRKKLHLEAKNNDLVKPKSVDNYLLLAAFALIWPTLSVFNMIIPLISKTNYQEGLKVATLLEVALALGSAMAGFMLSKFDIRLSNWFLLIIVIFSGFMLSFYSTHFVISMLSTLFLGASYGSLRILARQKLGTLLTPQETGKIISSANALSAPLVLIFLGFAFYEYITFETIFTLFFAFLISSMTFVRFMVAK